MEQFIISHYLVIIPAFFCLFCLILVIQARKQNRVLAKHLIKVSMRLEETRKALDTLQAKYNEDKEFQNTLDLAELTTKLQKPRLDIQHVAEDNASQGKYSSVRSLAEQGLSIDEIASALSMSTHEADQLVNLSKLAKGDS